MYHQRSSTVPSIDDSVTFDPDEKTKEKYLTYDFDKTTQQLTSTDHNKLVYLVHLYLIARQYELAADYLKRAHTNEIFDHEIMIIIGHNLMQYFQDIDTLSPNQLLVLLAFYEVLKDGGFDFEIYMHIDEIEMAKMWWSYNRLSPYQESNYKLTRSVKFTIKVLIDKYPNERVTFETGKNIPNYC